MSSFGKIRSDRHPLPARALPALLLGVCSAAGIVPGAIAETRYERMIGPGVRMVTVRREAGPCVVRMVAVETTGPYIRLGTSLPLRRNLGVVRLSAQADHLTGDERYPIAGINGDYFIPERGRFRGVPIGASISSGEIVHSPYPRSALIIGKDGSCRIDILKLRGWVVRADGARYPVTSVNHPRGENALVLYSARFGSSTRTASGGVEVALAPEALPLRFGEFRAADVLQVRRGPGNMRIPEIGLALSGLGTAAEFLKGVAPGQQLEYQLDFDPTLGEEDEVIGGGPRLVRGGRVSVEDEAGIVARTQGRRRLPRTAVGIRDGTAFLVTVDGRRRGYSVGMTLWELGRFMVGLGCRDAMALDGGGSTTLWVRGSVRNRPSDGRERPVANGLLVFSSAPRGPASRLMLTPATLAMVAGASASVRVAAEDEYYNPVAIEPRDLRWSVEPPVAAIDESGRVVTTSAVCATGAPCIEATAWAEAGRGRAPLRLKIYPAPPSLQVTPAAAHVRPGQSLKLAASPLDERGRPLLTAPGLVRWSCPRELGEIDPAGFFRAGPSPAGGWITASLNSTVTRVKMSVGTLPRLLTGFEEGESWPQSAFPARARATTELYRRVAQEGAASLRLRYNFQGCTGTRVACARARVRLGNAAGLRLALWGDASGAALRARVLDSRGRAFSLDLCPKITWKRGWRDVAAAIPPGASPPLTLDSVYLSQTRPGLAARGAILIDNVRADYAPEPGRL
jgi:hypothetical protein